MKSRTWLCLSLLTVMTMAVSAVGAGAAPASGPPSPFVGHWEATDPADGSVIRLSIGGLSYGPFNITWTEDYMTFCAGAAGIVRGTGLPNDDDPNLLEAYLVAECLATGKSVEFSMMIQFEPAAGTLSTVGENGEILWHRPGRPATDTPEGLIISPFGTDEWVRPSDDILLRWGWTTCTAGQAQAFINAVEVDTSLDDQPLEGEWSIPQEAPEVAGDCRGNGMLGWVTHWAYFVGHMDPGDHVLRTAVTITHPVTDGLGGDGKGKPDQYSGVLIEWVTTIHVAMPFVVASAAGDWMWTSDFAPNEELEVSVFENQGSDELFWQETAIANEDGFVNLAIEGLEPGQYMTVSDGVTEKELLLLDITVTLFDPESDLMEGTAPAGSEIWVAAGPQDHQDGFPVTVAGDGTWSADFTDTVDVTEDMRPWSYAQIFDDDRDINEADPPPAPPNPWFTVFPEQGVVEGWDFPLDSTVDLGIDNPYSGPGVDFTSTGTVEPYEGEGGPWLWIDFSGEFDVEPGYIVTLEEGTTSIQHEVRNLEITSIDLDENSVAGSSDPDESIVLWSWEGPEDGRLEVTANSEGAWSADFDEVGDEGFTLEPGFHVRAEIWDENGNDTAVDREVPHAQILAQITEDWFEARTFTPNADLSYEIYASQGGDLLLSGGLNSDEDGNVGLWVGDDGIDLLPGNYIVVSDGFITKRLVLENLHFDLFDLAQGLLTGRAPPPTGRTVWAGIGFPDDGWDSEVSSDEDGSWSAEYGGAVSSGYAWVAAQVFDGDGDASEVRPDDIEGLWVEAFTGNVNLGSLDEGVHPYYLAYQYSSPSPDSWSGQWGELDISDDAELYEENVLLRGSLGELHGVISDGDLICEEAGALSPTQAARFVAGWIVDYGMTEEAAQEHFSSLTIWAGLDESTLDELDGQGMRPYRPDDPDSWYGYVCLFTGVVP